MEYSGSQRIFVNADGIGPVVEMFVAIATEGFCCSRAAAQKGSALFAECFIAVKDPRFFPAFTARNAVVGAFDAAAADSAMLRIN